jgi:hypothetical protein
MMDGFFRALRQPEYVHVLLNPLPIYGLAMGWIGLLIAIIMRSRRAQITTLIVVLLSAASVWPVSEYGDQAKDPVIAMENETGQAWIEEHERRADQCIPFFYALAVLSAAAVAVPMKWPKSSLPLTIATLVLATVVLGMGGYIAYAGGKIRHKEFRNEPPPKPATEQKT